MVCGECWYRIDSLQTNTYIQYNTIDIDNMHMVHWRAESELWAVAGGEDGETGRREDTEEIMS